MKAPLTGDKRYWTMHRIEMIPRGMGVAKPWRIHAERQCDRVIASDMSMYDKVLAIHWYVDRAFDTASNGYDPDWPEESKRDQQKWISYALGLAERMYGKLLPGHRPAQYRAIAIWMNKRPPQARASMAKAFPEFDWS